MLLQHVANLLLVKRPRFKVQMLSDRRFNHWYA